MTHDIKTEEDVKVKFLLPYLREKGYPETHLEFNKAIEIQEGRKSKTIFADVVVYASAKREAPIIVCETKAPDEILSRNAKEQVISYARLLPKIAPIALLTNGYQTQIFQTLNKNRISDLPEKKNLRSDIIGSIISQELQDALRAEARHELFIIDDVQKFKGILSACHREIRNNEGYDPIQAFDEMSKILFCKLYEEKENSKNNRFLKPVFDKSLRELKVNVVQKIFEDTKIDSRYGSLFPQNEKIQLSDRTIGKIVGLFENYDLSLTAFDVKGEAFEYFLSDTFTGGLGEYFTPRNVVEFIVDAMNPKIGEKIVDPFCGTGGFLIYMFDVISEKIRLQEFSDEEKERWRLHLSNSSLYGTDWKERTIQACRMNMMVHGDGNTGIFLHHGLKNVAGHIENGNFDICVTNPPFGSFESDPDILAMYELGAGRQSQDRMILAIERAIKLVKPNGRIGIVVADGLLNNPSNQYVRDYIQRHSQLSAIVSLGKETFEGYNARAKTTVLFLQKRQTPTDNPEQTDVFMAVASNTGYAPNGAQISGNQLPDILMGYRAFEKGSKELSNHKDAWVTKPLDRLDAEYYWKRSIETFDIVESKKTVSDFLSNVQSQFNEVSKLIDDLDHSNIEFESGVISKYLSEISNRELLDPDKMYRVLGVRWWGQGVFLREQKRGSEIKAKYLYRVEPNWIIYNRLFAFRASFALTGEEHAGCYISSEFPTFVVKPEIEHPELIRKYLVQCLISPRYINIIDSLSTGSTKQSRNRLNQKLFLSLKFQIPKSHEDLKLLVDMLERVNYMRSINDSFMDTLITFQSGVASMIPEPDEDHKTTNEKPITLHQISFDEALDGFLSVSPPPAKKKPSKKKSRKS